MASFNKIIILNKEFTVLTYQNRNQNIRPSASGTFRIVKHLKATSSFLLISTDKSNSTDPSNLNAIPIQQQQLQLYRQVIIIFFIKKRSANFF